MKKKITKNDFVQAFIDYDKFSHFGNSHEALEALFEHLTSIEEDTGIEIELDVIELCLCYQFYRTIAEYNEEFGTKFESWEDEELEDYLAVEVGETGAITRNY